MTKQHPDIQFRSATIEDLPALRALLAATHFGMKLAL